MTLNGVVLPDPFGPISPVLEPRGTVSVQSVSACTPPHARDPLRAQLGGHEGVPSRRPTAPGPAAGAAAEVSGDRAQVQAEARAADQPGQRHRGHGDGQRQVVALRGFMSEKLLCSCRSPASEWAPPGPPSTPGLPSAWSGSRPSDTSTFSLTRETPAESACICSSAAKSSPPWPRPTRFWMIWCTVAATGRYRLHRGPRPCRRCWPREPLVARLWLSSGCIPSGHIRPPAVALPARTPSGRR